MNVLINIYSRQHLSNRKLEPLLIILQNINTIVKKITFRYRVSSTPQGMEPCRAVMTIYVSYRMGTLKCFKVKSKLYCFDSFCGRYHPEVIFYIPTCLGGAYKR